jgi:uncharacterized protein YjbI with pentapeptide repeats
MKILGLAVLLSVFALPALAQNAEQVARVEGGASCPHCNIFQVNLNNKQASDRNFAGARMRQADFSLSVFKRDDFHGADLRDVNGYGALFTNANMSGANLTNATFVGAYLEGTNFRGATLDGVNFAGAEMDKAVGLTQRQLDRACGDDTTKLPRGLRLPTCK